jgi:dihydroxyacid dehydratase/phosphogluconate dehydratase
MIREETNEVPMAQRKKLRSQLWFDDAGYPDMTALYLERYLNYGLTRAELQSGRPIIGIAQTGSDLVPCNRHHLELAHRVRAGIRDAGGVPIEFPQEIYRSLVGQLGTGACLEPAT